MKSSYAPNHERWSPKSAEVVSLNTWGKDEHPLWKFFLLRNGYRVSAYVEQSLARRDYDDRVARFPLDDWGIFDRTQDKVIEFTASKVVSQ